MSSTMTDDRCDSPEFYYLLSINHPGLRHSQHLRQQHMYTHAPKRVQKALTSDKMYTDISENSTLVREYPTWNNTIISTEDFTPRPALEINEELVCH